MKPQPYCARKLHAFLLAMIVAVFAGHAVAAPVVYLAGDSTVITNGANTYPQMGWGGRLPALFATGVSFSNRAVGGRSTKSFVDEGRLSAILETALIYRRDHVSRRGRRAERRRHRARQNLRRLARPGLGGFSCERRDIDAP